MHAFAGSAGSNTIAYASRDDSSLHIGLWDKDELVNPHSLQDRMPTVRSRHLLIEDRLREQRQRDTRS